jgi:hypothetical protein
VSCWRSTCHPRPWPPGSEGRVLLRPWQLTHAEYIAHGFDQLRQAAPPQLQVVAALLRVLRMLVDHVQRIGRTQHVPALRRQLQLLLRSLPTTRACIPATSSGSG